MLSSVLSVVACEFGRMACAMNAMASFNGICAETVLIGFRIRIALPSTNFPFFLFLVIWFGFSVVRGFLVLLFW
jgi:hypothetical protein